MKISVKLFAFLGNQLGPVVTIDLPTNTTVAAIKNAIIALDPLVKETVENSRLAINQEFINQSEITLNSTDEVALIPPVSGG